MTYILLKSTIVGLHLDDEKKEIRILVDIMVGIEGDQYGFNINNSQIPFIIKGFFSYDELSEFIKSACTQWVSENYPSK